MRVTQNMLTQQFLYNLTNDSQNLQTLQNELSSGKTLNSPSDNPLAVSQDMAVRTTLSETSGYQSSISAGLSWMNNSSSALQSMISSLQSIQGNVLQAVDSSNQNTSAINGLAQTTKQLVNQVYGILDTKQGNRYLFNGTQTDSSPATYVEGNPGSVFDTAQNALITPGSATVGGGVTQVQPAATIATTIADPNHLLPTGTALNLVLNASNINSQGAIGAGTLKVVTTGNPSQTLFSGNLTGASSGSSVTLKNSAGQSITLTLGNLFDASASSGSGAYSQTDRLTPLSGQGQNLNYQVAQSVSMPVNVTAAALFQTIPQGGSSTLQSTLSTLVSSLNSLSADLSSGNSTDAQLQLASLKTASSNLDANLTQVINANADLGARNQRLQALQSQMSQYTQTLQNQKSNLEDANMAQVITQFSTDQNVYQSALKMGAQVLLPSLISFLP